MGKSKLKISLLLQETGAFILTYNSGCICNKEGRPLTDETKQRFFAKILNEFERKEEMFKFLSDAKTHLNSPKESVGFFVKQVDDNLIKITRLYFLIGISMWPELMENINYQKFFDEFIDLEGKTIVVEDPKEG